MNRIIKYFVSATLFATLFLFNGCDELNNLPVNVPIVVNFSTSGSNTTLSGSSQFCLSDYQKWRDNQDGLKEATFVSVAYWTESATPGLQADITVTLSDQFGNQLFSVTLANMQAADNIDTPFTLELTEAEIQAVDNYLSSVTENGNDQCFSASITISNITADSTPFQLTGRVELVIEADVEL